MIRMIYEESQLRNEAIKVFKELSCMAGTFNLYMHYQRFLSL